jgi:SAM-dependent methyltransferase
MSKGRMRYTFLPVEQCNMCGSPASEHRVIGRRLNGHQGAFPKRKPGIAVSVKKCRRCSLVFADPQPVPFDLQDHYGVPPEAYWQEKYFHVSEDYFAPVIARFKRLAAFRPGMTALDIGAGLGKAMIGLERAGFDTYGIEPSVPFRERAIERMGRDPERLRGGGIEEADYAPEQFDFITFSAVLEHLYDPSASIAKAMKWLRPGGLVHIEVPSSRWLVHRLINAAYRLQGSDFVGNISPMHPPYHLYEFGIPSFQMNGQALGYEIAFQEHYVSDTYMPSFLSPLLKAWMRMTGTGMQLSIWLSKP